MRTARKRPMFFALEQGIKDARIIGVFGRRVDAENHAAHWQREGLKRHPLYAYTCHAMSRTEAKRSGLRLTA